MIEYIIRLNIINYIYEEVLKMQEKAELEGTEGLQATLELMGREELVLAVKESMRKCEELSTGARLLMTHLKVLCHKNGGSVSYTKEEYEATVKDDPDLGESYSVEDGKEVCTVKIRSKDQRQQTEITGN